MLNSQNEKLSNLSSQIKKYQEDFTKNIQEPVSYYVEKRNQAMDDFNKIDTDIIYCLQQLKIPERREASMLQIDILLDRLRILSEDTLQNENVVYHMNEAEKKCDNFIREKSEIISEISKQAKLIAVSKNIAEKQYLNESMAKKIVSDCEKIQKDLRQVLNQIEETKKIFSNIEQKQIELCEQIDLLTNASDSNNVLETRKKNNDVKIINFKKHDDGCYTVKFQTLNKIHEEIFIDGSELIKRFEELDILDQYLNPTTTDIDDSDKTKPVPKNTKQYLYVIEEENEEDEEENISLTTSINQTSKSIEHQDSHNSQKITTLQEEMNAQSTQNPIKESNSIDEQDARQIINRLNDRYAIMCSYSLEKVVQDRKDLIAQIDRYAKSIQNIDIANDDLKNRKNQGGWASSFDNAGRYAQQQRDLLVAQIVKVNNSMHLFDTEISKAKTSSLRMDNDLVNKVKKFSDIIHQEFEHQQVNIIPELRSLHTNAENSRHAKNTVTRY